MKVIGLTGGIGMGKSTAAAAFRRARLPVFDADAAVHRLQARGGRAVAVLAAAFPGSVVDGAVDRTRLRAAVLGQPAQLERLEAILHPMVRQEERAFLARARRAGARAAVLDIPLLLEAGGHRRVDTIVVVSAPRDVQVHRVRLRRRMSQADIAAVIARQMPDREKRRHANLVVHTGLSRHHALRALRPLHARTSAVSRSVLFDTETTGLDPAQGHRVVEIAAIELINDLPTKNVFHALIDPDRDMPEDALRIHGITAAQLRGKPRFAEVAPALLGFLGDDPLVAHNAPFDFGFVDAELARIGLPRLQPARMIDTLALAKLRFPGMPNSLDALCRRFEIDLSARTTHNALLDCRLLADVYVELTGGRQRGLSLTAEDGGSDAVVYVIGGPRVPRPMLPTPAELAAHTAFVARLRDPVWLTP